MKEKVKTARAGDLKTVHKADMEAPTADAALNRRNFLNRILAGVTAGGIAMATVSARASELTKPARPLDAPQIFAGGNHVERMRKELLEALRKPVSNRKWTMVIDLRKCVGCKACTISCIAENKLPPGVVYRIVTQEEVGKYPNVRRQFLPRPCMHCDNPPCVPVCPVGATWKRADGIVVIDYDRCMGCRYCITACPYNARTFDFGEYYEENTPQIMAYETGPSPEYGQDTPRPVDNKNASPKENTRKCHFCLHRIENGMLPACVTTCIGGATYFGDLNHKKSLVHELVGQAREMRLKEELGTKPSVYYLK